MCIRDRRYYYHENVYRPSAESHAFKEIGQMGLEFLGGVGEAEVQQAVCLAAQSLGQLGTDWVLEVSHMGYLFGLLDACLLYTSLCVPSITPMRM